MKRDWKKELGKHSITFLDNNELDIDHPRYGNSPIYGYPYITLALAVSFIDSLLSEQEAEWKQNIRAIFNECTTDWGTTDFEMAAEKVLNLVAEKK